MEFHCDRWPCPNENTCPCHRGISSSQFYFLNKQLCDLSEDTHQKWVDSGVPFYQDKYNSKNAEDPVKIKVNNFFVQRASDVFVSLRNMGFADNDFLVLFLDGQNLATARKFNQKLPCLSPANILIPNFSDALIEHLFDEELATPLLMTAGPKVPEYIREKFPDEVKIHDLFPLLKCSPKPFAVIWLDYCAAPENLRENVTAAIDYLPFAPIVLFGVTSVVRAGSEVNPASKLDNFIFESLSKRRSEKGYFFHCQVERLGRRGQRSALSFFYRVTQVKNLN